MVDRDENINDGWTVGELLDEFEDEEFKPADPERDHFTCDFCSKGVNYTSKPRVGGYVTDNVLNVDHPMWRRASQGLNNPLVPLASYCEDCSQRLLLFPCRGFAEVRIFFDLDRDKMMQNVEVTDLSPSDDGIPWDPRELSEAITEVSFRDKELVAALTGHDHLWGPENMVTFFLSIGGGVDIRQLVNFDGSLNPKILGRARKEHDKLMEKMEREGHDRGTFRNHVRGDR